MGNGLLKRLHQATGDQHKQLSDVTKQVAIHQGQLSGITILIEGLLHMGFFRRVWWALTGKFDRQWAVQTVRKAYEEHQQEQQRAQGPREA